MNMFTITIPASSANIGPGFDSAGIALSRYLSLHVTKQETWEFVHHSSHLPFVSHYEDHFIYHAAKQIAEVYNHVLPPCKVEVDSEIPLARGLGSSASAVIAGIELANQLCSLSLTLEQKLNHATVLEGHPDNAAPIIFGGFLITANTGDGEIDYFEMPPLDLDVVLYIPDFKMSTETARNLLPASFSRKNATTASGISNMMIAAFVSGDYLLAGRMMEKDLFHEPYRAELIPNYDEIKVEAKKLGAYGTVISGAGSAMISFVPKGQGNQIAAQMKAMLPQYDIAPLKIDHHGLQVSHCEKPLRMTAE
ncbi:homoserine kinase [Virgibacillus byunsanensis]|uniref:Homoserine kinase n=1 Tax=Virgibacillus byunsanensis TaxID=570945 RepID=A0ABW3LSB8_9BACI